MTRLPWGTLLVTLAVATPASADTVKYARKPVAAQLAKAAGDAFARAVTADEAGDLELAGRMYKRAFQIAPHPNTAYNLADVLRRAVDLADAAFYFEMYLALSPRTPDRAEIEALIATLLSTPGTLRIRQPKLEDSDASNVFTFDTAYIFVDGQRVWSPGPTPKLTTPLGAPMIEVRMPPGKYNADVISAVSYDNVIANHCVATAGREGHCLPHVPARVDGNVVLDTNQDADLRAKVEGIDHDLFGRRSELTPGKHWVTLTDRQYVCAPIQLDAPADAAVRYIFVRVAERSKPPRCRSLQVEQHLLKF